MIRPQLALADPIDDTDGCPECGRLKNLVADLSKQLQAAGEDVHALDIRERKNLRRIRALEAKLLDTRKASPLAADTEWLLAYARETWKKPKNWATDPKATRYETTQDQLKRKGDDGEPVYTREDFRICIDMLAQNPWVGGRGRSPHPYTGAKKLVDIDYAIGTDERITRWLDLHDEQQRANYLDREPGLRDEPLHQVVWTIHTTHPTLPLDRQSDGAWTTVCLKCRDGSRVLIEQHHDGLGYLYATLTCEKDCDESKLMLALGVDPLFMVELPRHGAAA